MQKVIRLISAFVLLVLFYSAVAAQSLPTAPANPAALRIVVGERQVRFTALQPVQDLRLQVFNQTGETVYDSGLFAAAELNWDLRGGDDIALPPGLYAYTLSLRHEGDETPRKHMGHLIIEQEGARFWLTAKDAAEVVGGELTVARTGERSIAGAGERAGVQRDAQERKVEGHLEDGSHATPAGPQAVLATAGRLAKFNDAAGNLTDSGVLETAAGGGLVQTFGNTPATNGAFNHVVEIVAGTGKTPLTLVGGSGSMEFWKDAANGGFPTKAVAFGVATPGLGASDDMVFSAFTGSGWFERMRLTNGGNLGIGTTDPVGRLNIVGSEGPGRGVQIDNREIKFRGEGDAHFSIFANRVARTLTIEDTSFNFNVGTPGNVLLAINRDFGYVGINKSNPNFTLDINGTLSVGILGTGGSDHLCRISFNQLALCSSSIRYKTNIATFLNGLVLIRALTPVTFDWKSDGKHDLGLVAEDVEKVSPLLVTYNNGQVEGVKYDRLGVVLINAIKEQQAQLEAKEAMIRALEARLAVLEERVRQIAGRRGQALQQLLGQQQGHAQVNKRLH